MSAVIKENLPDNLASSTEDLRAALEQLARNTKPTVFALRTPLLTEGRTDKIVSATDKHWIQLKCYASGGENALHSHLHEDHSFVVLQGEAVFYGPQGEVARLGRYQGITIPRGNLYRFHACSEENLVLLRVGAPDGEDGDVLARVDEQGRDLDAFSETNAPAGKKREKAVIDPGKWFE